MRRFNSGTRLIFQIRGTSNVPAALSAAPQMIIPMAHNRHLYIIGIVFFLALFLRLYHLGSLPFSFHDDEVYAGYVGRYLLLHGGQDITGNRFPIAFDRFGDYRPIGIFIASGLSTFIFGVNEFAVRFPGAFFGALSAISLYVLSYLLFRSCVISTTVALAIAIMPWHVVLSRSTSEGIVGLFFCIVGLSCTHLYVQKRSIHVLFFSLCAFIVSYLFYHPFRLLIPCFIVAYVWYPRITPIVRTRMILLSVGLFLTSVVFFSTNIGKGRLNQVFFTQNAILKDKVIAGLASEGPGHIITGRIFHNKLVVYTKEFISQYTDYFSPRFLFINGGKPDRYVVPHTGLLPYVFMPLILLGFVSLFIKPSFEKKLILYMLTLAPLPGALTYEDIPNIHRAIVLIVPCVLLVGLGVNELFARIRQFRLLLAMLIVLVLTIETVFFWHMYEVGERSYKSFYRNDMYREVAQRVKELAPLYENIYAPSSRAFPLYYAFFSNQFDLSAIEFRNGILEGHNNIVFIDSTCPSGELKELTNFRSLLVVDRGDCKEDSRFVTINEIIQSDSALAFKLLAFPGKK